MRQLIAFIAFVFIFSSCKNDSENNLAVYMAAEEGLERSNKNISVATDAMYHAFDAKLQDPTTKAMAEYWQPKVMEIKKLSDTIVKYLNGLKEELKNEAGGDDPGNKDWQNSMGVSEHLFESHGKGKELLGALTKYKEALLAVDPQVMNEFEKTINVFSNEIAYNAADTAGFTTTFFSNIPVIAANVMLSKLENNVKVYENQLVTYCYTRSSGVVDYYEKFVVLISQNSTYLKAGEELEINAGVGAITTTSNPKFTINGKNIPLTDDGMAMYRFKTSVKAGKYTVPVTIEYFSEDGRKQIVTKSITYTVVE